MRLKRGFVGPLGDDLPSLFPIVAAIVLFAGTIVYANGLVESKNRLLDTHQTALGLSYIATEKGLIDSRSVFETITCQDHMQKYALTNQVRFLVTVKRYCDHIQIYYPKDNPDPEYAKLSPNYIEKNDGQQQGQTWDYCTNVLKPVAGKIMNVPADAVTLTYPIAVPCPQAPPANSPPGTAMVPTNGLGLVNIIVWKEFGKS